MFARATGKGNLVSTRGDVFLGHGGTRAESADEDKN